ncbi:AMP-binding protein [Trueperella pyogenes]|uniref:AMP-binding protein n=1 Tax=Trueperella pyogenes TaxID=1661 RepID=UPI0010111D3D|nr:AMP-binding protein [Trueperella pyogenes]
MDQMELAHSYYPDGMPTTIEPVTTTIDHLLLEAIRNVPDRIAIDFLANEFTYAEIYDEVRRAAQVLTMCGVRKGDVISVILPNCPQHYVAFYAAQFLGVTVAEHNPLAPPAQIDAQIALVGSTVVIGWEQTLGKLLADGDFKDRTYLAVNLTKALPKKSQFLLKLPFKAARTQRNKLRGRVPAGVHSWDNQVKHNDPLDLSHVAGPELDDLAALLMTGGTTGTPKAVALSHRTLLSNTKQIELWLSDLKYGAETVGAVLPFFHAFGMQLSMLMSVNIAATQVMTPSFDVDILFAAHKRHPITFFGGVPPMFAKMLDAIDAGKAADLSSIRYAVCGAMALDPDLAKRWEERAGLMIEGYGMTEASPVIAGSPLTERRRPSTLGVPFPATEVKIVDPEDRSVEVANGEVGEIAVRGPQVFVGYFKNPEETANVLNEGWLFTGDLGRWDDGFIVMADRRKEMIINSGFNVYPSEVESAVRDMPGVVDVAVVGMPTGSFSESVVAALVLEPGAVVDLEAVRKWTEDKLSHYAMPKSIAIFEDLPRSQLGKVMRRAVAERLSNLELVSGQWRERVTEAVSEATAKSAETITEYMTTVKEKASHARSSMSFDTRSEGSQVPPARSADEEGSTAQ